MDVQLYIFINGVWKEYNPKPAAHSHKWSEITEKPTTFNPMSHSHKWSEITEKPTTFTPSTHSHGKAQITNFDNEVLSLFPAWVKKTSLAIGDIPTGTTETTVALGNHTHSQYLTSASALNPANVSQTASYRFVTDSEKTTWHGKQSALGYTPENAANKRTSIRSSGANDTSYVSELGVKKYVDGLIGSVYRPAGDWNANTNAPALANNTPANAGKVYRVSVAGTRFGFTFAVGDKLAFNESGVISKWDNVDDVTSVNGQTGTVVLTTDNVSDATQTNKFVNVAQATWIESLRTRLTHSTNTIKSTVPFEASTVEATTRLISPEFRLPAPTSSATNWRIVRYPDNLEFETNVSKLSLGATAGDSSSLKGNWLMDVGYTPNNIRSIVNKGYVDNQSWKLIKSNATAIDTATSSAVTVTSGNYYGKTLAIEISVGSSDATYNKTIIFVTLGSLTTSTESSSYMRNNASFTSFDGQFLNTISFRARASTSTVSYIYLENLKSLSGSFSGSEILWSTSTISVYNTRIWLVQ